MFVKPVSMGCDAATVELREIRLEKCVIFRLDLPGQRQSMAVRARSNRLLHDVVEPVLARYEISLKDVSMLVV